MPQKLSCLAKLCAKKHWTCEVVSITDLSELQNPHISQNVAKPAIQKATEIMQKYADNASKSSEPLFPPGSLHIVHAEPSSHPGIAFVDTYDCSSVF